MKNIGENLERSYQAFIDSEKPLDFFTGLGQYLDFVFSQSNLKKIFATQMKQRDVAYKELLNEFELNKLLERKRGLKTWSSFEKLYQFHLAYKEISQNPTPRAWTDNRDVGEYGIRKIDEGEMLAMERDLADLLKRKKNKMSQLALPNFKYVVKSVHASLMRSAEPSTGVTKETKISNGKTNLFLTKDEVGKLCRDSELKICSELGDEMLRIVTYLDENSDYISAKDIAYVLEKKSEHTVRSAIQKINKKVVGLGFTFKARVQEDRFIEGSKLGYRINRNRFNIVPVDHFER